MRRRLWAECATMRSRKCRRRRLCAHALAQWRLAARQRECMWRVLQAVSPGKEHMLAINRTCGRCGPVLAMDTDFGGAAHITVL